MTGEIRRADETFTLNGVEYPFMLERSGGTGFATASPFSPKTTTGDKKYGDYDALSAIAFSELTGGSGQEYADDVTRYRGGLNIDTRGGKLILGPQVTLSPLYGLHDTIDDVLSEWRGTDFGGTATAAQQGMLSIDSTRPRIATKITTAVGCTKLYRVWLGLKVLPEAADVIVRIYSDLADQPDDLLASVILDRSNLPAAGAWFEVKLSTALTVTGNTNYWISVEHDGAANACLWEGAYFSVGTNLTLYGEGLQWLAFTSPYWIMLTWLDDCRLHPDGPLMLCRGAGEDNISRLWGWHGRCLYYLNAAGIPTVVVDGAATPAAKEMTADIVDGAWYRSSSDSHPQLYLALGDDTDMQEFDGNVGTEGWTTVTGHQARALCVHNGRLWFVDGRVGVGAFDGTNWGATQDAGDHIYPVQKLCSWNGYLWAGKEDGLYKISPDATYPASGDMDITKELDFAAQADDANFRVMLVHQGDLYFSLGTGLMRYTIGGVLTPVTPQLELNVTSHKRLTFSAACSTLGVLWAVGEGSIENTTTIYAYVDGSWHPVYTMPRSGDMCRGLVIDACLYGDTPRLWFSHGLQMGYLLMPTDSNRRWLWDNMTYSASGYLTLSMVDGGIRTVNKDWIRVEVDARNVGAVAEGAPYGEIWYRTDIGEAWTKLDTNIVTIGLSSISFPTTTYGAQIQLRIMLYAGTLNGVVTTPRIEAVVLKYMLRPTDIRIFTRMYKLGKDMTLRNGVPITTSVAQQVAWLKTLRDSAEPLAWLPVWDTEMKTVHVIDYSAGEDIGETQPIMDVIEMTVRVRLQEL